MNRGLLCKGLLVVRPPDVQGRPTAGTLEGDMESQSCLLLSAPHTLVPKIRLAALGRHSCRPSRSLCSVDSITLVQPQRCIPKAVTPQNLSS